MLHTIKTLLQIRVSSGANRILFYAQKLPLVGRRIPESAYRQEDVKSAFAIIAMILGVLWGFANKLAYAGLFAYLPAAELDLADDRLPFFLHIMLLLSFLAAGISAATMLEPKREKYVAVKLMRMSPGAYKRTQLAYRYTTYFIYYVPTLILCITLLGGTAVQGLMLAAALTLWRVLCEYAHLKLFEKTGIVLIKKALIVWLTIGAAVAAAYAPIFTDAMPLIGMPLTQWWFLVLLAVAGLFAALRLARYADYRTVVDAATRRDDPLLDLGKMMSDAQVTTVETKGTDYEKTLNLSDKYGKLEGYAYLNALFFARHRSLITTPVYKRLAIIAGFCAAGTAAVLTFDGVRELVAGANMFIVLTYLILVMSFLLVGERACRAMFYHCDLSLMRYSFYRQAAHRHYRLRLVRLAGYNLAVGAALAAALSVILHLADAATMQELTLLWVSVLAMSIFFSVHHLLMYYLLQPYSPELNVKNPFFFLAGMVISAGFVTSILIRPSPLAFTAAAVVLTLIYVITSVQLVRRVGARTFRIK